MGCPTLITWWLFSMKFQVVLEYFRVLFADSKAKTMTPYQGVLKSGKSRVNCYVRHFILGGQFHRTQIYGVGCDSLGNVMSDVDKKSYIKFLMRSLKSCRTKKEKNSDRNKVLFQLSPYSITNLETDEIYKLGKMLSNFRNQCDDFKINTPTSWLNKFFVRWGDMIDVLMVKILDVKSDFMDIWNQLDDDESNVSKSNNQKHFF